MHFEMGCGIIKKVRKRIGENWWDMLKIIVKRRICILWRSDELRRKKGINMLFKNNISRDKGSVGREI